MKLPREFAASGWVPEVLRQHALQVWGAGCEKENSSPPKVYRLVGKSVDEVRALACEVSPVVTGTEEWVRLNRIEHEMLQ